jgi:hypothetical protein
MKRSADAQGAMGGREERGVTFRVASCAAALQASTELTRSIAESYKCHGRSPPESPEALVRTPG